jgi:hypothetical protein
VKDHLSGPPDPTHVITDTKKVERPKRVLPESYRSADSPDLWSLLEYNHLSSSSAQSNRRGETDDATARYQDAVELGHLAKC